MSLRLLLPMVVAIVAVALDDKWRPLISGVLNGGIPTDGFNYFDVVLNQTLEQCMALCENYGAACKSVDFGHDGWCTVHSETKDSLPAAWMPAHTEFLHAERSDAAVSSKAFRTRSWRWRRLFSAHKTYSGSVSSSSVCVV